MNLNREHAEALRTRLDDPSEDIEVLAQEAREIFRAAEAADRVRWIDLELGGYGTHIDVEPLHDVLGVEPGHELVTSVIKYRRQSGIEWESGDPRGRAFLHFFVESISELKAASVRVHDSVTTTSVVLEFGPQGGAHPREGEFSRDVFDRVLLGFRAALHLQLGRVA